MIGFRILRARWRLARANAEFLRCKDEWNAAEERQDCRRLGLAAAELRAARNEQLRAERALAETQRRRAERAWQ